MAVACLKTSSQLYSSSPSASILSGSLGTGASGTMNSGGGHLQSQLTRSLERILEDANLSGELKLSGRKLKDFPKAAGKYNLSDTVIADLSRNRFCELPEDITSLAFLERLLVFHNTIRSIPETIRGLHSLTYLDLRNNQLSVMPREICFLPLQVLLVSNNRLVTLPDELGRMEELTELDAACNQITHLPPRLGDLRNLRSLTLRNNQLVYLPRDLTVLQLVFLDISCNKITTLPVELRHMSSLVDLELSNNPLTSPPASLCVRGLVHVFKYLETAAAKEEKSKSGLDGHATLRRSALSSKNSSGSLLDGSRNRRAHVDSGYSTSDGGFDGANGLSGLLSGESHGGGGIIGSLEEEFKKGIALQDQLERKKLSNKNNIDISPEGDLTLDSAKSDEKMRTLGNIQTYREYKEALRQQRNQVDIYRPKEQQIQTPESSGSTSESSPLSNFSPYNKSQATTPSPSVYSNSSQSSPLSPHHCNVHKLNQINANGAHATNGFNQNVTSSPLLSPNRNIVPPFVEDIANNSGNSTTSTPNKRPVQKVIPSRNISTYQANQSPTHLNGNHHLSTSAASVGGSPMSNGKIPIPNGTPIKTAVSNCTDYAYVKPNSPCKASTGILTHNSVPSSIPKPTANGGSSPNGNQKPLTATVGYVNGVKPGQKPNKTVSWNRDVPNDKLSFTMRREFDKQKEETELIEQLRQIIETRLKMTLPEDIAPALTDGVVLCHLANYVRPRSVGSIHVPSPAVPKLTMARCRRNVDNFLDACRKIGVDEELICSCQDIVPSSPPPTGAPPPSVVLAEVSSDWPDQRQQQQQQIESDVDQSVEPPNPLAMYRTIEALLTRAELVTKESTCGHIGRPSSPPPPPPIIVNKPTTTTLTAANTNTTTTTEGEQAVVLHSSKEEPNGNYQTPPHYLSFPSATTNESNRNYLRNTSTPKSVKTQFEFHLEQKQELEREDVMKVQARLRAVSDEIDVDVQSGGGGGGADWRNVPVSLDLNSGGNGRRKRKFPNSRFAGAKSRQQGSLGDGLNEIVEECEYDSDIGKFRCRLEDGDGEDDDYEDSEASVNSLDDETAFTPTNANQGINDLNSTTPTGAGARTIVDFNINSAKEDPKLVGRKIVSKRIEFFESNAVNGEKIVNSAQLRRSVSVEDNEAEAAGDQWNRKSDHPVLSTVLCLGTFLFAVVYLYLYPLPNR
ncbi:leucine-rich repeat and calponin homology domain-containing protein isoform X2 [Toxorhynchites rutilus septentrionalis]|uniref:leucine-rich repeat and calponin homology domain-containing protein isoform X2 n=1 Tax=Toxorhynchites rutilus septentrionalis TaxID=329112 RepID=UPI0024788F4D|nr:leucine-rich repeat and calponin homology domain-containing protein isoform X2 [Toxorhynchites rutilus septentrionalis]